MGKKEENRKENEEGLFPHSWFFFSGVSSFPFPSPNTPQLSTPRQQGFLRFPPNTPRKKKKEKKKQKDWFRFLKLRGIWYFYTCVYVCVETNIHHYQIHRSQLLLVREFNTSFLATHCPFFTFPFRSHRHLGSSTSHAKHARQTHKYTPPFSLP